MRMMTFVISIPTKFMDCYQYKFISKVGGHLKQQSLIHLDYNNLIRLLLQYISTTAKYTNQMTQFS